MELTDICGGTAKALAKMDREALADTCLQWTNIFDPTKNLWALIIGIAFGVITPLAVLIHRAVNKEKAWVVFLEVLENMLFGATAGYAGVVAGVIVAVLAHPFLTGSLFAILGAVGVIFCILAAVNGDADVGWKVLGIFHFILLLAQLAVMAAFCFMVPTEGRAGDPYFYYLLAVGIGLGVASGLNAVFSGIQRGNFYGIGFVLLVINGSWGFIGNLLGLMTHFASLYSYKDFGKLNTSDNRICFVCYEEGFSLKSDANGPFAFTEGAVMSVKDAGVRKHEAVHVAQHYLLGPIYPLSHFLWFIVMIVPGLFGALAEKLDAGEGITRMSYYNNPYEVMAYGMFNQSSRKTTDALIWGWPAAATVSILYGLATIAGFIGLLYWRLS